MSATHGFKFETPDGKQHKVDVLNSEGVILLAKHSPNNRASKFPAIRYGQKYLDFMYFSVFAGSCVEVFVKEPAKQLIVCKTVILQDCF